MTPLLHIVVRGDGRKRFPGGLKAVPGRPESGSQFRLERVKRLSQISRRSLFWAPASPSVLVDIGRYWLVLDTYIPGNRLIEMFRSRTLAS